MLRQISIAAAYTLIIAAISCKLASVFLTTQPPESTAMAEAANDLAQLVVSYPEAVDQGSLIEVDATESVGADFAWSVDGVEAGNYRVVDGGRRLLISADKVGEVVVWGAVALNNTVDLKVLRVGVQTSGLPTPEPPPDVNPKPNPDLDAIDHNVRDE